MVERVEPGSIAAEIGISPGDRVLAVNGTAPGDILDWRLAECSEELVLTVRHGDGQIIEYEIAKEYDEPLGIVFPSPVLDKIRSCRNRCLFCFVDQLPQGMRNSLYLKDDDYRLSFLSGSYITLTNLSERDLVRITRLRLSPLYVSVHATDPYVRRKLLSNQRAGEIMKMLQRLADTGISFHAQAVLCPGINDGYILEQTIDDLFYLHPAALSLAVVPVGLTGHRQGLFNLAPYDKDGALAVLELVERRQELCLRESGTRFVFAADEFYTMAGKSVPPDEAYEGYPQLENGVGLIRLLYNSWEAWRKKLPGRLTVPRSVIIATGKSAAACLEPIVSRLNGIAGLTVKLVPVPNRFFGGHVSVAGLLTASDIKEAFRENPASGTVFLPKVMLKEGTELFLDGYTLNKLSAALCREVRVVKDLDAFLTELFGEKVR